MSGKSNKIRSLKASQLEEKLRSLLQASLSDEVLRAQFEEFAHHPSFPGFTWLWGPELYKRNRVMFRPFILSHFGSILFEPPRRWKPVQWKKETGRILDDWLEAVDDHDDIELFRRLYQWKITSPRMRRPDSEFICRELLERFKETPSPAGRRIVLAKFDLWFTLDETTAMELYEIDPEAAGPFILRHLPVSLWGSQKRKLWARLCTLAQQRGDDEFYFALYRRQVPFEQWQKDVLALFDTFETPPQLVEALERRHPQGYGLDLGETFYKILVKGGRTVFPYIMNHLQEMRFSRWWRGSEDKILDLARKEGWLDLWTAVLRVCARPKEYNREIGRLLDDQQLTDQEIQQRLLMLAGVSREWNYPGLSFARVHPLDENIALKLYERFPHLLRGPFKLHVSPTWQSTYPRLIKRLIGEKDEPFVDFMASRLATRRAFWGDKKQLATAEMLADHYEALRNDSLLFSRRAGAVLGQIPAYAIYDYHGLIRDNRLARLLFERSSSFYLDDPLTMLDLIEAPEIHVQAMAYRALGLDDARARQIAADNLDILMGTLLRPLHRKTRLLAFAALLNAAPTLGHARRIHNRAREALDLPDIRYPKEKLVGLIGQLLKRWPDLRSAAEQPVIFGEVSV